MTKSRAALVAENQLFRAQLDGSTSGIRLNGVQQERLQSNQVELDTRAVAARAQVEQLSRQSSQTEVKLAAAKQDVATEPENLSGCSPDRPIRCDFPGAVPQATARSGSESIRC